MTMPDLQRYSWNLNLIKNVEDNAVFLTRKVLNYDNFSVLSYKQEMRNSIFHRKHKLILRWKKSYFIKESQKKFFLVKQLKRRDINLIHSWSDKSYKGTVVNRTLPSLQRESFEIKLTFLLKEGSHGIIHWQKLKRIIFPAAENLKI